jgi:hypothetical protein
MNEYIARFFIALRLWAAREYARGQGVEYPDEFVYYCYVPLAYEQPF